MESKPNWRLDVLNMKSGWNSRKSHSESYFKALNASKILLMSLKHMSLLPIWASISGFDLLTEFYGSPFEGFSQHYVEKRAGPLYIPVANGRILENRLVAYFGLLVIDTGTVKAFNREDATYVLVSYRSQRRGVEITSTYTYPPKSLSDVSFFALNRGVQRSAHELAHIGAFAKKLRLFELVYERALAEPFEGELAIEQRIPCYYRGVSVDAEILFSQPIEGRLYKVTVNYEISAGDRFEARTNQSVQITLLGFDGHALKYKTDVDERALGELLWAFISDVGLSDLKTHIDHVATGIRASIAAMRTLMELR